LGFFSSDEYERGIGLIRTHGIALKGRVSYPILSEVNLELSYFYNDMHVRMHGLEFAFIANISKK